MITSEEDPYTLLSESTSKFPSAQLTEDDFGTVRELVKKHPMKSHSSLVIFEKNQGKQSHLEEVKILKSEENNNYSSNDEDLIEEIYAASPAEQTNKNQVKKLYPKLEADDIEEVYEQLGGEEYAIPNNKKNLKPMENPCYTTDEITPTVIEPHISEQTKEPSAPILDDVDGLNFTGI